MGIEEKEEELTSQGGSGAEKVKWGKHHLMFQPRIIFPGDFTGPFEGAFLFGRAVHCPLLGEKSTYLSNVQTHNSFQELTLSVFYSNTCILSSLSLLASLD